MAARKNRRMRVEFCQNLCYSIDRISVTLQFIIKKGGNQLDSSCLAAIIEALTKLFNPKLEKELAKIRLEQDIGAFNALLGLGLKPEFLEYCDGRLHFKMHLPEISDTQSLGVISLEDLERIPFDTPLQISDYSKLKLEPPQKKYE